MWVKINKLEVIPTTGKIDDLMKALEELKKKYPDVELTHDDDEYDSAIGCIVVFSYENLKDDNKIHAMITHDGYLEKGKDKL